MCNVGDFSGRMTEKVSSFAEARKRPTRGKSTEVINLEPLVSVEPKGKRVMLPTKRKAEISMPVRGKLMVDTMRSTRSSRRLAGLRTSAAGVGSSGVAVKEPKEAIEVEKFGRPGEVYIPYWNLSKTSRLISVEEKREWVESMMPLGARTKFDMFKETELGSRTDHAIYEVKNSRFDTIFMMPEMFVIYIDIF